MFSSCCACAAATSGIKRSFLLPSASIKETALNVPSVSLYIARYEGFAVEAKRAVSSSDTKITSLASTSNPPAAKSSCN